MSVELTWDPPGPGAWWSTREHFPQPVSHLFATIFPEVTLGWSRGGERFGLAMGDALWGAVNGWMYYSSAPIDPSTLPALEQAGATTLATKSWRDEVGRWLDDERPRVVAANRSLQAEDVDTLDDAALADHLSRTIENFSRFAPLHFEHLGFEIAGGLLFRTAAGWGLDPVELTGLLAGASPGTSAVERHLAGICEALDLVAAPAPSTLADVRAAGDEAALALDAYLEQWGWRALAGHDLAEPTLGERPELVIAAINVRRGRPATVPDATPGVDAARSAVPAAERDRFDELLADARASYGLRDDDVGVCFNWPLGLVRRAVLEAGRRLAGGHVLILPEHAFEADPAELAQLLTGNGPDAADLASRAELRAAAAKVIPPMQLGEYVEQPSPVLPAAVAELNEIRSAAWVNATASPEPLHGIGVGTTVVRGRARVVVHPSELVDLVDGDILVTVTTTTAFNAVFPLVAGVITEEGGLFSHTALLARELCVPAVIGVPHLLDLVHDGDEVELDPVAGAVRVL